VFSTAFDSAPITSSVKVVAFQFYLQSGKQRKIWWVGITVILRQKFHSEKGSVRQCIVVMKQAVILSPKFKAKSSHIFTVAMKLHSIMWN
jgi:hypothetical protein